MRVIFMVAIIWSLFGCNEESRPMGTANIYYVPIGTETYVPVTTENIEELAVKKGTIDLDNKDVKRLVPMIKKAKPGAFDDGYIRVKLVMSDESTIYVDNNGGVMVESATRSLDAKALAKVKKIIESYLEWDAR